MIESLDPIDANHSDELKDELETEQRDNEENESAEEKESAKEKDDIELKTKDPVKKYQFIYNESLCMTNKYPEIESNENSSISIAPGEGQIPKDVLADENWDVKGFPHLHNPDGSNGKDEDRAVKLTDQNYFINRICNKEKRFARSPAYVYAALAYIEKK